MIGVGQHRDDAVKQVAAPQPLCCGDRHRLPEAEPVEFAGQRHVGEDVRFVRRYEHRQAATAQQIGHLFIAWAQPALDVDNEHGELRFR